MDKRWTFYFEAFETFLSSKVKRLIEERSVSQIHKSILYSYLSGGKRIRPGLLLLCSGISPESAHSRESHLWVASSLEAIHTYSLIHDDLPAMDDDDLRRGQPSNHRQFNEWTAILAGDALNTLAFELLTEAGLQELSHGLVRSLAKASGIGGMICGQVLDLETEKEGWEKTNPQALLRQIHRSKTGALLGACCEMGAILSAAPVDKYLEFGIRLGELFQLVDDILDIESNSAVLGKTAGKDEAKGKLTSTSILGIEKAKKMATDLSDSLTTSATSLPLGERGEWDFRPLLQELPEYIRLREK